MCAEKKETKRCEAKRLSTAQRLRLRGFGICLLEAIAVEGLFFKNVSNGRP